MNHKQWIVRETIEQQQNNVFAKQISEQLHLMLPVSALLCQRSHNTPEKARDYINKSTENIYDPFLMKDIEKGAQRILRAVYNGEPITIYGDYDVDGITSVSIMVLFLRRIHADVDYYIPTRQGEGYGVSKNAIDTIHSRGTKLIVTVDTGITAVDEIAYARSLGMDVVVTDHHECQDQLPVCEAVINPKQPDCTYPFKELAGVGVAFKMLCVLNILLHKNQPQQVSVREICTDYLDLVAIGTVADVMPIIEENRLIVAFGLQQIDQSPRVSLKRLLEVCSKDSSRYAKKITTTFISFQMAPRINSVGRLSSAEVAVELFLTQDDRKAAEYARILNDTNTERQELENEIVRQIETSCSHLFSSDESIVLTDEKWHHGIIGIIASRFAEKYNKPSFVITFEPSGGIPDDTEPVRNDEDIGKGSCRSVPGISLPLALEYCKDLLEKFGGHEMAAGFSIQRKNVDKFRERMNEYVRLNRFSSSHLPSQLIHLELDEADIGLELIRQLSYLEPYGVSNDLPVFMLRNVTIESIQNISDKHLKLLVRTSREDRILECMMFRTTLKDFSFAEQDHVDLAFELSNNKFRGIDKPQLTLKDIRLSEEHIGPTYRLSTKEEYLRIQNGEEISIPESYVPTRDDFAFFYKTVQSLSTDGQCRITLKQLDKKLNVSGKEFLAFQILSMIDVFSETHLWNVRKIQPKKEESFEIQIPSVKTKVNLEDSPTLSHLKSLVR